MIFVLFSQAVVNLSIGQELMKHTITLIPGDGIGPENVAATVRVIEATGAHY